MDSHFTCTYCGHTRFRKVHEFMVNPNSDIYKVKEITFYVCENCNLTSKITESEIRKQLRKKAHLLGKH